MTAQDHLYYGLGMIAFAVAKADGEIQASERKELHELIAEWTERYNIDFDITEIVFSIMSKTKPSLDEGFNQGMKYISLGSNHLNEQMKEHFIYLIQDIAHSFPPVTMEEENIISRFKNELAKLP